MADRVIYAISVSLLEAARTKKLSYLSSVVHSISEGYVDIHLWASRAEQCQTTINGNIWPIMNDSSSNLIVRIPPLLKDLEWLPIAVLDCMVRGGTSSDLFNILPALGMETPHQLFTGSCS
jgi:hypothetical protein